MEQKGEKRAVQLQISMPESEWGNLQSRLRLRLSMHWAGVRELDLVDGVATHVLLAAIKQGVLRDEEGEPWPAEIEERGKDEGIG